jgi:GDP-D-mannose 3', 5'-epimerase
VAAVADKAIRKRYDLTKPQGVRGRNSDNNRLREVLAWEPTKQLEDGLRITYAWICSELVKAERSYPPKARAAA